MRYCVIVFDFFGVISSEVAPFWLERHFAPDDARLIKSTLVHEADAGNISQEELFSELGQRAGLSADQVDKEWAEYVRIDSHVVNLIRQLKTDFTIALLSNSPSGFLRKILRDNDLEKDFSEVIISSEVHCAKPGQEIFELLLRRLNAEPRDVLFIDDNPTNIEGANKMKIDGALFKSSDQLSKSLQHLQSRQ